MRGKYSRPSKRGAGRKVLLLLTAMILTVGCTVGGTLAWLVADTGPVVNTFTYGDIDITLEEDFNTDKDGDGTYDCWEGKVVPGVDLDKNPEVAVVEGSESCYLFVKLEEKNWPTVTVDGSAVRNDKVDWDIATGWTLLSEGNNEYIYFREVPADATEKSFQVLANDKVTVSGDLLKGEIEGMTDPFTLSITAFACQTDNGTGNGGKFTPQQAWDIVNNGGTTPPTTVAP